MALDERCARLLLLLGALAGCDRQIAGGTLDGARIFSEACARCHGPNGQPDAAMIARIGVKPLTSDRVQRELKPVDIRRQIEKGSDNKNMPAFSGALSEAQIDAVVTYVKSLK